VTSNGSALTQTLPAAPPSGTWSAGVLNLNATTATVSRNGLLINGAGSNISLLQYQTAYLFTDGSNYFMLNRPLSAGSGISLSESATNEQISIQSTFVPTITNLLEGNNTTFIDSSGTTAYVASPTAGCSNYVLTSGSIVWVVPGTNSTTSASLTACGQALKSIKKTDGVTDPGTTITAGQPFPAYYDGTVWRDLFSGLSGGGGLTLPLSGANGGTGVANTGFTITLAGNVTFTGAFNPTFAIPATGTYTLAVGTELVSGGPLGTPLSATLTNATGLPITGIANIAANSFLGNNTGSSGAVLALTATQATAALNVFTSSLNGLAPSSGGGTTNFLRADGTWAVPPSGGMAIGGTITSGTTNAVLYVASGPILAQTSAVNGALLNTNSSGVPGLQTSVTLGVQNTTHGQYAAAGSTGVNGSFLAYGISGAPGHGELQGDTILGGILSGSGSTNDLTLQNKSGTSVCTGTTTLTCVSLGVSGLTSANLVGTDSTGAFRTASATDISSIQYVAGGGSANAQTATYSPAVASLVVGTRLTWLPIAANTTTTPTFAPNGLTATTIVKAGGAALAASDLTTTAIAVAMYDGTNWELQNPQTGGSGGANAVLNNQVNTGTAAMTLNMAASTVANPFQTPNAVIANSLAYSSGTSNPGTCTTSFPPTNNSYFYRTDLNQWEFCHATNTWELVGPQANGSMGLGGSYGFGGPVAIGTEAYVGNSPDVAALTIKHTTTDDLGNATGISNTRIWSPANNSGSYSAILLDQLMYIADPGTSMTVPFYTGESINMQLTGTHTTVTNWNSISIPAPTIPSGSTVGTLTALNIANPCSIAVTTCNAILVGGGIVNLSSASSVSLPASTATSLNGLAVTTSTGTLTVLNGTTLTNPIHQYGASFGTPGGTALTTGGVQYFNMPQACTIGGYEITADAGTATVKFWKIATGTAIPTSANSISTAGVSLGSGTHIYSTTVTDFTTTAVSANDIGAVTLTAVSGAGYVQAVMLCQ